MSYELITNRDLSAGLDVPLCYVNDITGGIFIPLVLMAIWVIFAIGGYFMQKRSVGTGDFPMSCAVAGFVTSVFAFILRLVKNTAGQPCLVDGFSLSVVIIVAGISVLWFLFSRD